MVKHRSDPSAPRPTRNGSRLGPADDESQVQLCFDFDRIAAPQATAIPPVGDTPESRFALRFAAVLEADPTAAFNNAAISQLAREIFGSSAGYARDAYDSAEAGFNIYLNRVGLGLSDTSAAIDRLLTEQARLPLQTRRDQNQIDFQQFSTPPAQALVVVKAASLCPGMTVLEPSAGTGNLAVLARLAGAQVDTNEIDPRRRNLLSLQGFEPTVLDAERLDNLLPADKSYHAIVMNPPFSATGGRVSGHRTAFGARHIEQALLRLKPGGRLVAIVGCGMAMERPAFRDWWADITKRYHVRANVGMDGREYAKFGTTFDNQIVVIDRDGPTATVDHGTLRGNMGITLQRLFPQARIRYFSATGATEARHMAPYERLGLWGAGAPFPDFPSFLVAMERGGVAAMEMLSRDLKSVGTYLSRTISYGPTRRPDGSIVPDSAVEYEPVLHRLSADERRQYDEIADLWSELLVAFESAEQNVGQGRNANRYAQFYSAQQRFFLQLMMAHTLPDVIPAIEQDLSQGRSVVLSLFNTGEAQSARKVRDARAEGVELSELDATPREMIVQLIEKQFPLYQYQEQTDPVTGNVVRVRIEDAAGNPEINRENQRRQQELLDKVADLDFPQNPLDALIARFGVGNVAEISGRMHRFENGKYVRRKLNGIPRRELNEYETRLFQQGRKRVAVISGAGSTGISVHADVAAKNQARRVFYAFQLSWSADQQMQAFGRVHRSNQSSAPVIRLVLLDLAGQKRLVNAVSKRLAALGALTKGERHSLSSDLFRPEDVTDEFGKAALARLYRQIQSGQHSEDGIGMRVLDRMGVLDKEKTAVRENYVSNVEQFLNRIMVLHVEMQNRIFDLFHERYLEAVEAAKRQSAFDFGMEEIRARNLRRIAEPETLFVDPASGARTMLHDLEGEVDVVRRTFESLGAKLGFYRNRQSQRISTQSTSITTATIWLVGSPFGVHGLPKGWNQTGCGRSTGAMGHSSRLGLARPHSKRPSSSSDSRQFTISTVPMSTPRGRSLATTPCSSSHSAISSAGTRPRLA